MDIKNLIKKLKREAKFLKSVPEKLYNQNVACLSTDGTGCAMTHYSNYAKQEEYPESNLFWYIHDLRWSIPRIAKKNGWPVPTSFTRKDVVERINFAINYLTENYQEDEK